MGVKVWPVRSLLPTVNSAHLAQSRVALRGVQWSKIQGRVMLLGSFAQAGVKEVHRNVPGLKVAQCGLSREAGVKPAAASLGASISVRRLLTRSVLKKG